MEWRAKNFSFHFPRRPLVMGILNVTPDSFSDGGNFLSGITKGKTTGGYEYQWVDCVQSKTGYKASIQLFANAVRVFMKGDYVEYQK